MCFDSGSTPVAPSAQTLDDPSSLPIVPAETRTIVNDDWTKNNDGHREKRATSGGDERTGNEIVRSEGRREGGGGPGVGGGPEVGGGRCLDQEEEEPELKYFYLNQNPEEVKILTSDNPTQRWGK